MAQICVFCASSTRIDDRYVALAASVGAELALRGHSLVSGGGSVSCMGAVASAARAGGARTVGVIPSALKLREIADEEADLVVTGDMRTRKAEMDRRADAFLTLPGGLGTLEELLEIWVSRTLRMHDKPLVVLDPYDVFAPLRAQVAALIDGGFARTTVWDAITWVGSVEAAFDEIDRQLAAAAVTPAAPTGEELLESEP